MRRRSTARAKASCRAFGRKNRFCDVAKPVPGGREFASPGIVFAGIDLSIGAGCVGGGARGFEIAHPKRQIGLFEPGVQQKARFNFAVSGRVLGSFAAKLLSQRNGEAEAFSGGGGLLERKQNPGALTPDRRQRPALRGLAIGEPDTLAYRLCRWRRGRRRHL